MKDIKQRLKTARAAAEVAARFTAAVAGVAARGAANADAKAAAMWAAAANPESELKEQIALISEMLK